MVQAAVADVCPVGLRLTEVEQDAGTGRVRFTLTPDGDDVTICAAAELTEKLVRMIDRAIRDGRSRRVDHGLCRETAIALSTHAVCEHHESVAVVQRQREHLGAILLFGPAADGAGNVESPVHPAPRDLFMGSARISRTPPATRA